MITSCLSSFVWTRASTDDIIIIITVFIQRLTHRRLVYNGITQVWEVLEWRQSAANRKVQPASSLQPTPPLWCTCPSRSWSQLCCLVGRGTCVWTTYPRLLCGMPRSGIELATFRSRVANANHWATAPHNVCIPHVIRFDGRLCANDCRQSCWHGTDCCEQRENNDWTCRLMLHSSGRSVIWSSI